MIPTPATIAGVSVHTWGTTVGSFNLVLGGENRGEAGHEPAQEKDREQLEGLQESLWWVEDKASWLGV